MKLKSVAVLLPAIPPRAVLDLALTIFSIACGAASIYGVAILAHAGVLHMGTLISFLSLACPLAMMVQYVSPVPVVVVAVQTKSAKSLNVTVFQSQAACNILGLAYGIQRSNAAVLITNMFGLACQIAFLAFEYHIRSPNANWTWFSIKLASALNSALYIFATLAPLDMLGHAITLLNIVLFASPLSKVGNILRTKDASPLPTGMTGIALANNALWTLFALLIQDIVLLLPSILGFLMSTFQVLVILWCRGMLPFDLGFLLLLCRGRGGAPKGPGGSEEEDLAGSMELSKFGRMQHV